MINTERVYLDWAAASPLWPEAKAAMEPFLMADFGNPSAIHREGQVARQAVERARRQVAEALQVRPEFMTFTGGGTEGNNLAIVGTVNALHQAGQAYADMEVLTTKIEHPSVLRSMKYLGGLGVQVKYVEVDAEGRLQLEELRKQLSPKTVLVSVAYANSEIGVVQSLHGIKKVLRKAEESFATVIQLHVDAAQAPLWLSCQFGSTGADLMVLDAAKCGGPKGVGVLVQSRRATVVPIAFGGGQEQGTRPGTENVAGIVGAGVAIATAQADWRSRAEQVARVRDEGVKLLLAALPTAVLNGPREAERLANNINISIPGLDTEFLTVVLDRKGFAVSTKSACSGAGGGASTVVQAIAADPARALATLRITLGPATSVAELKTVTTSVVDHVKKMSQLSG